VSFANAFSNLFRIAELRKRLFITLSLLGIYRLGVFVTAPGVNRVVMKKAIESSGGFLNLFNLFTGGALEQLSIFALGIMPYVSASIILQLLTVVVPTLEKLSKEGEMGRRKITQWTRYVTVILAIVQSFAIGMTLTNTSTGSSMVTISRLAFLPMCVLTLTTGTAFIMWLGEQITERGVGNGMSLLIFTSIAARIPAEGGNILHQGGLVFVVVCLFGLAIIASVVFVEQGQRRIPVQYAKRMVGRRMYGGTSTYLPLKVNQAGVIPVIFASSLLYLPQLVSQIGGSNGGWLQQLVQTYVSDQASWVHILLYFLLIVFFTYFYVAITFSPDERADEMKKFGGFIPGIRPGRPTAEYLNFVLSRITLPGSLYLGIIAVLPNFFLGITGTGQNQNFPFGGTAVLIMVGVGLDTVKQIESQLMQRNYEGFLR